MLSANDDLGFGGDVVQPLAVEGVVVGVEFAVGLQRFSRRTEWLWIEWPFPANV